MESANLIIGISREIVREKIIKPLTHDANYPPNQERPKKRHPIPGSRSHPGDIIGIFSIALGHGERFDFAHA